MDSILCGKCALFLYPPLKGNDQHLSLRKGLAVRFEAGVVYRCDHCNVYMMFDGFRWFKYYDFLLIQSVADSYLKRLGVVI